jgi:hypothetical protein
VSIPNDQSRLKKERKGKLEAECPLWVISGHRPADQGCPLCPRMQTCSASKSMSALCQKRVANATWAPSTAVIPFAASAPGPRKRRRDSRRLRSSLNPRHPRHPRQFLDFFDFLYRAHPRQGTLYPRHPRHLRARIPNIGVAVGYALRHFREYALKLRRDTCRPLCQSTLNSLPLPTSSRLRNGSIFSPGARRCVVAGERPTGYYRVVVLLGSS